MKLMLALFAVANAASLTPALKLRGGSISIAGIEPEQIAMGLTVLQGLQGVMSTTNVDQVFEMYEIPKSGDTPTARFICEQSGAICDPVKAFIRDVYDHAMQAIDIVETYRETASGLNDLYQSSVGNKMNEIMKVLTIMASFFIPVTFVAGVYGMNFEHMPELGWRFGYPAALGGMVVSAVLPYLYFKRKGWL